MARELVGDIYRVCKRSEQLARDFGLRSQIQRAAVSVMANIAEGFERANSGEKRQHYNVARASSGEVRSLLYVLLDAGLIEEAEFNSLKNKSIRAGKLISGLLRSLDQQC